MLFGFYFLRSFCASVAFGTCDNRLKVFVVGDFIIKKAFTYTLSRDTLKTEEMSDLTPGQSD